KDATYVNSSNLTVPEGYELITVGDFPINDGYVYVAVRPVENKEVKINFYDEVNNKQVKEEPITVDKDATYVNSSNLTVPEGYELITVGDFPINDGYVYVAVRPVEKKETVKLTFQVAAGDRDKAAIEGFETAEVEVGTGLQNQPRVNIVKEGYRHTGWTDEHGKFYATLEGLTFTENKTFTAVIQEVELPEVPEEVESVKLNKDTLTLRKGRKETLTYTITPGDAQAKEVKWTSNNPEIASVDNGVVTAHKVGKAIITLDVDGKVDTCAVTVKSVTSTDTDTSTGSGSSSSSSSSSKDDKKDNIVERYEDLNSKDKAKLQAKVIASLPYTVLKGEEVQLMEGILDKEDVKFINEDIDVLEDLDIEMEDYVKVVELEESDNTTFADVKVTDWMYTSVTAAASKGLVEGTPEGLFMPKELLKTSDTCTLLDRVLLAEFDLGMINNRDEVEEYVTNKDHWAFFHMASIASRLNESTIEEMVALGNEPISRGFLAQILFELLNDELEINEAYEATLNNYTDIATSPYQEAIEFCISTGLMNGVTSTEVQPEKGLTRAELVVIMERLQK
ncbi:S-layer homology domain-containing protein, partial [Zhenhengia yiwuensis]|uniref:S-layer homology domain-containing protein n=1 Tax=Zhenhengia yiwuensis TaxID=2763666 RepID=UPI002A7652AC